jgi:uncharacterized membrane protein
MRTPTSLRGHPLHPILVAIPIGLFGIVHMCVMLLTVVIFAIGFWMRHSGRCAYSTTFIISLIGLFALLVGGWWGAKLVHIFGMTIEEDRTAGPERFS